MSREDATYFFLKSLDPDTDLGFGRFRGATNRKNWRHGSEYSGISVEYFFQKKVGGDISCIRRIYWSKGFSVKGPPAELLAIKASLIEKSANFTSNFLNPLRRSLRSNE